MKRRRDPQFFATEVTKARRFYYNLAASPGGALRVVAGGIEHCGADYCVDRQSFPFPTIEYIVRGQGDLLLAGKSYALGPGSLFAYTMETPHRISCGGRGHLVKYFVAFIQQPDIMVRDVAAAAGYDDPFHFSRVFRNTLGVSPSTWRQMNTP
jgi:AraC-like DNA-binding protein